MIKLVPFNLKQLILNGKFVTIKNKWRISIQFKSTTDKTILSSEPQQQSPADNGIEFKRNFR
jgi:hypothetical protein